METTRPIEGDRFPSLGRLHLFFIFKLFIIAKHFCLVFLMKWVTKYNVTFTLKQTGKITKLKEFMRDLL